MKAILLGNRGSRVLGASEFSPWQRYGGDTTCIGILADDQVISHDTGSAFYKWDYVLKQVLELPPPYHMTIVYSHYHMDHTNGLAQAPILFTPGNTVDVFGPPRHLDYKNRRPDQQLLSLQDVFAMNANEPSNPNLMSVYQAQIGFNELGHSRNVNSINLGGKKDAPKVSWMPVKHGGIVSYAYRIDHKDQSICIISDTHHEIEPDGTPILDPAILAFIKDADALVYDSHFTDKFFAANSKMCQAFGHSTGEHGVRLCQAAGVGMFVKHHHNPNSTDIVLDTEVEELIKYGKERGVDVVAAKPSRVIDFDIAKTQRAAYVEAQTTPDFRNMALRGELTL